MSRVILIASGKGGVGKTTLTANLAGALSRFHRVLAIDGDVEMCNLDIVLGMRRNRVLDSEDLFSGRCSVEQVVCTHPKHENLSLLFAPFHLELPESDFYSALRRFVLEQRSLYDFILIDCPSGIGAALRCLADMRFELIIVATPDATSVSDGEKTAAFAFSVGMTSVRLVVNRIRTDLIRKGAAPNIDEIMDGVCLPLLGLIPDDDRIIAAQNEGVLLMDVSRAKVRRAFENISRRIEGKETEFYHFK